MDVEHIKKRIEDRYAGVYGSHINDMAESVSSMDQALQANVLKWLETGELENAEVAGYSVRDLQTKHGMNELAAFLTLDWLIREPEKATASLQRGHDTVTWPKRD